jgi:hypothetical protein
MSGNIRGWLRSVLNKVQVFGRMRLGHQRAILAACPTVPDPGRILVTRYADTTVEGTAAQPAVQHIFVVQLTAVPTLLFAQQ